MNCPNHATAAATHTCSVCGRAYCGACVIVYRGAAFCEPCKASPAFAEALARDPEAEAIAAPGKRPDAVTSMLIPVGRSPLAIAAGYLGLISPCLLPAPFAVLCGALAIREIRRNPASIGMGRAIFGIVMGALFTVFGAIGVVAKLLER